MIIRVESKNRTNIYTQLYELCFYSYLIKNFKQELWSLDLDCANVGKHVGMSKCVCVCGSVCVCVMPQKGSLSA